MKKVQKNTKQKASVELYELHRYLLSVRVRVKAEEKAMPIFVDLLHEEFDPEATVDALLSSHRVITQSTAQAGLKALSPDLIFESGICLCWNQVPEDLPKEIGKIPDLDSWPETPRFVPRTNEEAEERSAAILASKKQKKQRGKAKSDNQTASPKRVRLNDTVTEAPAKAGQATGPSAMEMEKTQDA
jgi:hypothetical protein